MLDDDVVDVWWLRLDEVHDPRADLLTSAERGRYDGYRRDPDRRRFAAGAAVVRLASAGYAGTQVGDVLVDRTCPDCGRPHGKVRLPAEYQLEVSVTHSGDWIGVAFTRAPVGLDVERINTGADHAGLARMALGPAESAQLDALPEDARAAGFTRFWARKEAVLKSTGEGLRTSPKQVTVSAPDEPPRLLRHAGRAELAGALVLVDVDPDAEHPAAVAVLGGEGLVVRQRDAAPLLRRTPLV